MGVRDFVEAFQSFRAGAPLGDVALMKFAMYSGETHALDARLAPFARYAPKHDLAVLRALPAGSLGRVYATFLDDNGITPLEVSPAMLERFADHPYAVRYTLTHDLHHTLTGFDAGLAGETGVAAFMVGQGAAFSSFFGGALRVMPLLSPSQARAVEHNRRLGLELGRRATLLIAEPLEELFAEPIDDVRARFHLPSPADAGILPSGRSAYLRFAMSLQKKRTMPS